MSRRILLTGGTGYLGSNFARSRLADVDIITRPSTSLHRLDDVKEQISLIPIENLSREMFDWDIFVHAATCYGRNGESEEQINRVNIDYPLEILSKIDTSRLVFVNIDTSLPSAVSHYASSKSEFIKSCRSKFPKMPFLNLEFQQFYGPGDNSIISRVLDELRNGNEKIKLTNGEQARDYIYISDAISAINHCIDHYSNKDSLYHNIPIGSGKTYVLREVLEELCEAGGFPISSLMFGSIPYRKDEVMHSVADNSELKKTGWQCKVSMDSGLKELLRS